MGNSRLIRGPRLDLTQDLCATNFWSRAGAALIGGGLADRKTFAKAHDPAHHALAPVRPVRPVRALDTLEPRFVSKAMNESMKEDRSPAPPDQPGANDRQERRETTAAGQAGGEAGFDAVGAAAELEAAMAAEQPGPAAGSRGNDYVSMLESEVEELNALVAEKERRIHSLEDEVERSRERIEREAARELEQRSRKILLGFLAVLDDLDRALAAARQAGDGAAVLDGVDIVRKRFLAELGGFGVRHAPSMGTRFDPAHHEAMSVMPVADPAQDGVVVGVIREGYLIGEEVLRPAGVAVGKLSGGQRS